MKAFSETGAIDFIGDLEESFKCGSMCAKPLFPAVAAVADGPVSRSCSRGMLEDASGSPAAAGVAGISALMLFIAGFGAFPLCSDFAGKSKE